MILPGIKFRLIEDGVYPYLVFPNLYLCLRDIKFEFPFGAKFSNLSGLMVPVVALGSFGVWSK